eukprot:TRINITY_DN97283_c0_g1_i1.p1 TRINITY_DN97283_c0_g1~~TRINITY_DN97283_c0_g1_i1.p1  ORF type:complete len:607 (-),score=134.44 TRINITY_DN97283_c0_g1_i1:30-1850(-)
MALLFQVFALPVAIHLASLSHVVSPHFWLADLREACRQLLSQHCSSNKETSHKCAASQNSCRRLAKTSQAWTSWSICRAEQDGDDEEVCQLAQALSLATPMKVQEAVRTASAGLCDAETLRKLADDSIHRNTLEDFANGRWRLLPLSHKGKLQPLESVARSWLRQLLEAHSAATEELLARGCCFAHGFALLSSMLRVQLIILAVGLLQDLISCIVFCMRKMLSRCLLPFSEAFSCALSCCPRRRLSDAAPLPDTMLRAAPLPDLSGTVRQRTRAALEALAAALEVEGARSSLAGAAFRPEDIRRHAAELNFIQERCVPMRAPMLHGSRQGAWWLAGEGAAAEPAEAEAIALAAVPRRLGLFDLARFCGVLLPLPCTVILAEQAVDEECLPKVLGLAGLSCAGLAGLLERQPQRWHPSLLHLLAMACAGLGGMCALLECEHVVLSAAILASLDLRSASQTKCRCKRVQLSASFAVGHLLVAAMTAPDWPSDFWEVLLSFLQGGPFCSAALGLLTATAALFLLRALPRIFQQTLSAACLMLACFLLPCALALLLQRRQFGIVAALWWITAWEALACCSSLDSLMLPEAPKIQEPLLWKSWVRATSGGA